MSDYISRKAAIKWFYRPYSNEESYSNVDVERALKSLPVADVIKRSQVDSKIEEALAILDDIFYRIDYSDYTSLHDAISLIGINEEKQ